jgi:DNA invertase Pin-like site-specific DNA recombinase
MRRGQPKIAVYCRVSSKDQNPRMQLAEIREYCHNRGWTITSEYIDAGFSGAKDSRPQLDRLIADAHRRRFDVVVVWKFDRFARSVSHLLRSLELFASLGIGFVSLSEQIDTGTPAGKLVFTVLGAVAELERSLIAERVRAGLRNAKANGKKLGRRPLRVLDSSEMNALRKDRRKGLSFQALSQKYRISVWSAFYTCKSERQGIGETNRIRKPIQNRLPESQ